MLKKYLFIILFLLFGFLVLVISVLRSASLRHSANFNTPFSKGYLPEEKLSVDYFFASAGKVLPDSPLWGIKVARDKFWLFLTPGLTRKSELNLLLSDKRLVAAKILIEKGKYSLAYETILKSHNYFINAINLEAEARKRGNNTDELLLLLNKVSLAHKEVIENLKSVLPDEIFSRLVSVINELESFYYESSIILKDKK